MLRIALERWRLKRPESGDLREWGRDLRSRAHVESRAATPECLDELAVADFIDGALTGERREQVLAHLGGCARCRSVVHATSHLVADEAIAREIPGGRRQAPAWARVSVGVAAAAAAVLVLATWPRDRDATLREPAVTNAIAPVTLSPRGNVAAVDRLVWSRVPGAERYRVRLHRGDGTVVWSAETEDSLLSLPDTAKLSPGSTYYWRVDALTEWRRWVESEMTHFQIEPARR